MFTIRRRLLAVTAAGLTALASFGLVLAFESDSYDFWNGSCETPASAEAYDTGGDDQIYSIVVDADSCASTVAVRVGYYTSSPSSVVYPLGWWVDGVSIDQYVTVAAFIRGRGEGKSEVGSWAGPFVSDWLDAD